ncbi:MAG: hypothetical protein AAGF47_10865, partial [Planctomycetota bacterium]
NDPFELEVYRTFVERWRRADQRFRYDELRAQPTEFFAKMLRGMGFGCTQDEAQRAAAYVGSTYHSSSGQTGGGSPDRPLSETRWAAPSEVLDVYLNDEHIRAFMAEQRWPTTRRGYDRGRLRRLAELIGAR